MEGPPLGPGGEDITWTDQVAPRGQKASSTRKIKPQTSNRDAVPVLDFTCGPYPRGGARGRGVLEGQLHPGTYGVLGIQGGGFLCGPTLRLGFWLGCGFGLCWGLALLRTLAALGIGPHSLGRRALGLLYRCVAPCIHGVFTGGWDVGLGLPDGVLQLEHLLGHDAKRLLGLLQGVGRARGPGEEPVPGACSVAAHVGLVAGGVACPRWGAFWWEGAPWRPLCAVEGVVQRFPGYLWGVGDAGGESQAVSSSGWGRDFVAGGVGCCPSDLAVVVPVHSPPDVPVFEDVDFRGVQGGVHCVPAEELDGADLGVGLQGCSHVENLVDVLGVGPVLGVSCAAWARVGEGQSSQRREADTVAYRAAIRTCSVSPSTMRWFPPSRSRGMLASALRVRSAMARLGPGVACIGSSGGRLSDGVFDKV